MNLDTNNHSVFLLNYHLIMCIKYRNKVIDNSISSRLKEIFEYIAYTLKEVHTAQNLIRKIMKNIELLKTFCFEDSQIPKSVNLLMHINPQVVALLKKNFL